MGCYIETPVVKGKADWLMNNAGARPVSDLSFPPMDGYLMVCVVDNGPFEAAAIAYSREEWKVFTRPDGRMKMWLWVPRDRILEVEPGLARRLEAYRI